MGVELGKVLAKNILKQLDKPEDVTGHDSSVRAVRLDGLRPPHCVSQMLTDCACPDHRPHPLLSEVAQGVSQHADGRVWREAVATTYYKEPTKARG